ncbi:MAG TPA: class I SAM-dependent methyltransferase, partial [Gemmataceae bacterium]|nr:class I SAM-dependent methyltransferase [Gemmataceae bacterium]
MTVSQAQATDAPDEAESVRALYASRDLDRRYERQWGYVNPTAAGYWKIRDELVCDAVCRRFDVLTSDLNVLEVGVGHGHELAKFALLGIPQEQLTGVDVVPERLVRARAIYPAIQFEDGDARALPFADACFDVVCQFTCAMHAPSKLSQELICREMSRVLRPGGIIIWWDIAPARWRLVVAQRLTNVLFGPKRLRRAPGYFWRTLKELLLPRRRRQAVASALPPYILPVSGEELANWFPGLTVRARRAG